MPPRINALLGPALVLLLMAVWRRPASPAIGSVVTVQFRRDQLHHSAAGPINVSPASADGAQVCLTGYLVRLDHDWVVLSYEHSVGGNQPPMKRETWIPRAAVLFIEVDKDRTARPQP